MTSESLAGATDATQDKGNALYAALARTATRSIALYFSRPVRLFRPSKVSGWHSLRGHALGNGASLTPQYLSRLIRQQGPMIIPRHFFPPIMINAALGTVLWTTYTETSSFLEPRLGSSSTMVAALSGAIAGGMQACIAAPAENVRLVLEGGTSQGWSHAWKEVFQGTSLPLHVTKEQNMQEIRQVRDWMKDVKGMAGRGWDGWGWACAKDICGFAAFFAIFDITRHVATTTRAAAQDIVIGEDRQSFKYYFPRTLHSIILVAGGVIAGISYEFVSRPWDVARRTVQLDRIINTHHRSATSIIMQKFRDDGPIAFFRDPTHTHSYTNCRRRLYGTLRTLARVGPWGFGFLAWEAFGSSLN